ncbi:F-box domain-containing protein [Pleurotus pulmonarius]
MSQLPNELLQAIVSHSERTSLLNLAIVSKRFNALAIPILYQDIIFHIKDVIPISLLRRDIHTNQGIQYTKAFAIHFFPCHFDGHDQVRADVDYIIPHLVNIRRLCLARQCVSPGVLSRLPASVQLTDLILDHTHCSQDLPRFLLCNPTLEAVAVHNSANDGRAIELAASNLPKLRTLEIAFNELVHIKGPMPSVANLSVHPFPLDRRATGHIVLNFPSLCSLSLPHVDLPVVFSLAQSLPNLEFLRVSFGNSNVRPNASDFAVFSKLRYMRFVLHRFSDEGLALELFHAVQSLVIMEVCNHYNNLRWVRSSDTPVEGSDALNDNRPIWGEWWVERARERIEKALNGMQ